MNCIVGVRDGANGAVVLACDSAVLAGETVAGRHARRIFWCGKFLIGCATSTRMAQILQHSFVPPEIEKSESVGFSASQSSSDTDLLQYLCTTFVDELRAALKKGGLLRSNNGIDDGGTFLVAHSHRLFVIYDDFAVEEMADPFTSVGPGAAYAVASMKALSDYTTLSASEIAERSLQIAAHFTTAVRSPFSILSTAPSAPSTRI
jgi:ATP-dependent protease HslVU (ClpYQ) peptidase subunit